jgi:hypothetical protein
MTLIRDQYLIKMLKSKLERILIKIPTELIDIVISFLEIKTFKVTVSGNDKGYSMEFINNKGRGFFPSFSADCPFCEYKNRDALYFGYYTEIPMISCDNCDARSFIDCKEEQLFVNGSYEFKLLKIVKVVDYRLVHYISNKKLNIQQVTEILNDLHVDFESSDRTYWTLSSDISEKYNLNYYNGPDKSILLNLSVPVNSYNLNDPEIKYPDNILVEPDDDTSVYCLLENKKIVYFSH